MTFVLLAVGLVLLIVGAEVLVRGASRLALSFGISPLIIGLTVVAFGTSSPELAVSLNGVLSGEEGVSFGNIIGSNIFNVLVVLGLSAMVAPLFVAQRLVRFDVPLMIVLSVLVLWFAQNGEISTLEGAFFVGVLVLYIGYAVLDGKSESSEVQSEYADEFGQTGSPPRSLLIDAVLILVGFGMLVLGSQWLVDGATEIAVDLGVSDLIIGLTIVATGTSMPEVATSVIAAFKGERDIAVGNVVGSNIFNILSVLGITALVSPGTIPVPEAAQSFDLWVMVAVAVACLPVFLGGLISRWEGALFLAYYFAYVAYLILDASGHDSLEVYSDIMLLFVVPLTVVTLLVILAREVRRKLTARNDQNRTTTS